MRRRVLVFGNGTSGNAVAIALRRQGHEVTIMGSSAGAVRASIGEHLPPEALPLLQGLGVAQLLLDANHLRSPGIVSFWQGSMLEKDYPFSVGGDGYNLDRLVFDEGLKALANEVGVCRHKALVNGLDRDGSAWVVSTSLGSTIKADFLIDASGRSASLARRLGAQRQFLDSIAAMAGRFLADDNGDARLTIETVPSGWWYGLRQMNARRIAVLITDASQVPTGGSARGTFWRHRYADTRFLRSLGDPAAATVEVWDARSMILRPQAGPGWASIGDASMAFDPLSAAGMSKALADALSLTSLFADRADFERDALDRLLLDRERRWHAYVAGLKATYGEFTTGPAKWWDERKRWANGLDGGEPTGRFNATSAENVPGDNHVAPRH